MKYGIEIKIEGSRYTMSIVGCEGCGMVHEGTFCSEEETSNDVQDTLERWMSLYEFDGEDIEEINIVGESDDNVAKILGISLCKVSANRLAEKYLTIALEGARERKDKLEVADILMKLATNYFDAGDFDMVIVCYEEYLNIMAVEREDHVDTAAAYSALGLVYQMRDRYVDAKECGVKSLEIYAKQPVADPKKMGHCHGNLGGVCRELGENDEALAHYLSAVGYLANMGEEYFPSFYYGYLVEMYEERGEKEEAKKYKDILSEYKRKTEDTILEMFAYDDDDEDGEW